MADTICKRFSPMTGRDEWCFMEDGYDHRQDILRSLFGDMLHDKERNKQYFRAIFKEVKRFLNKGVNPICLDIGTGTGLLSMMAAKSGVKRIVACEAFMPMAKVAKKIVKENGFENVITVVPKSSMDMSVPRDMPEKAELVVMELFDTELIGEGLLLSMRHAYRQLVKKNTTVVPASATIHIQLYQSENIWDMHKLSPVICENGKTALSTPQSMDLCHGAPSVHDVQADELMQMDLKPLTDPLAVLRFDFCDNPITKLEDKIYCETMTGDDGEVRSYCSDVVVKQRGTLHIILMWWVLQMDKDGEIMLSMAPKWLDTGKAERNEWRDHWMQGIYFMRSPLKVNKGENLSVITTHDDFAFWFDVRAGYSSQIPHTVPKAPICTCGAHIVWSRQRFAMVNDRTRRRQFLGFFRKLVRNGISVGLVVSDGSLISILAILAGFKKVYVLEPETATRRIIKQMAIANGFKEKVCVLAKTADQLNDSDIPEKIDVILGEPFFISSLLPWHDMYFWYASRAIVENIVKKNSVAVYPNSSRLKALAVELKDLWKIKAPLGSVEGFDVKAFDELINCCRLECEENEAEPHNLWEYPCRALTKVIHVQTFDFGNAIPEATQVIDGTVDFMWDGFCNAVIFWMDYDFDEDVRMSTGLTQEKIEFSSDGYVRNWVKFCKQGVYFLHQPREVCGLQSKLRYLLTFHPDDGLLKIHCEILDTK